MFDAKKVAAWGTMRLIPSLLERRYLRDGSNPVREAQVIQKNIRMLWAGGSHAALFVFALIFWMVFPHTAQVELWELWLAAAIGAGLTGGFWALASSANCEWNELPEFCSALSDLEILLLPESIQSLFESYPSDERLREIGSNLLAQALQQGTGKEATVFDESRSIIEFTKRHGILAKLSMVPEDKSDCLKAARKLSRKLQDSRAA